MIDIAKAKESLNCRERAREKKAERLFIQAQTDFAKIIKMIVDKYHPVKIIQWGSLLDKDMFTDNSDIDIALEGVVDAERFFALLGDAMRLTTFKLDIVQLERIEPEFRDIIHTKGQVVYEQQ